MWLSGTINSMLIVMFFCRYRWQELFWNVSEGITQIQSVFVGYLPYANQVDPNYYTYFIDQEIEI